MKKLMIVIVVFLIILSGAKTQNQFSLLDYFSGEYIAYTSEGGNEDSINLGFCYINSKPVDDEIIGESIVIENLEIDSALSLMNARVIKTEYLMDGTTVIYAYTGLINETVEVFGENVNLQLAIKDNKTTIGWPLILGSF